MSHDQPQHEQDSYPIIVTEQTEQRILLIDLENCPNHIQELQDSLRDYDKVIICYASIGTKIPLDWLMPLHETINSGRLHIHKMERIGKNAADFGIFFFAGMLAQQLSSSAGFTIISDDSDLDHLVSLLAGLGHSVQRKGKEKTVISPEPTANNNGASNDIASGLRLYCEHLERHRSNRPATQTTLRNSIRSRMGQNLAMTEAVLEQLIKMKAISFNGNKVIYQSAKISQLATMAV